MVSLSVDANGGRRILFDDVLVLEVSGVPESAEFTLDTRLTDDCGRSYGSAITYTMPPTGKWISNVHFRDRPMEMFELSSAAAAGSRPATRLSQKDVTKPQVVTFTVNSVSITAERWFMAEHVSRDDIRTGGLVGTHFTSRKNTSKTLVLDMFGTGGGLVEYKASLIASRGFDCIHVGLFNVPEELPNLNWADIDLMYLRKFLEYGHSLVYDRVVLHGMSMGGTLAICAASLFPDLCDGVVCVNGTPCLFDSFLLNGKRLPCFELNIAAIESDNDRLLLFNAFDLSKAETHCIVQKDTWPFAPVSHIKAPLLCIASADDRNYDSAAFSRMLRRLIPNHDATFIDLNFAGHLMEPTHGASCPECFHTALQSVVIQGGETLGKVGAEYEHAWSATIDFFDRVSRTHDASKL